MIRPWLYRRAAAVWFAVACTMISWAGLTSYWGTHQMVRSFDSAAEAHRALEKLQAVQASMSAAEASVDEYVITGNPARLALFREAALHVPFQLKQMEALMAAYPKQVKALQPLERVTLGHLSYLRNVARVRRTRGIEVASAWIASEDSSSPRVLTTQLLRALQGTETMDVRQRTAFALQRSSLAKTILALAGVVSLGFLIWAFTLWRRESRERGHAEQERERLHSFLYSVIERIPYIVLVKEARALRVVHANQAAARWLGRTTESLVGANVFDWRPAKEADSEAREDRKALAAGTPVNIPEEQVTIEGKTRIFHTQKMVIPDTDNRPAYLVTIAEDITERKQAEHLLELSRDTAVESARLKAEFLRNMTHEFRTPLSVIIGMSSLLEGTSLAPEQRRFTTSVRKAAEGLSQMIKNILNFSKIETGSFQLENEHVPLLETVENVVRMFSEQAAAKGVELTTAFAGDVPVAPVWGDRTRLRHVLTQLIGNAVKFTAQGAVAVRVTVAKEDNTQCWIHCRITDSGIGLVAEAKAHLYEAFRQGDGSAIRRYGGTGLGLAIAKRIVELMGGEIGFETVEPTGTTFWVTIPFHKQSAAERVDTKPVRVLIVDENETVRGRFQEQLNLWGLSSKAVASGEAALTVLRREQAAGRPTPVVLAGMHLLDMDGAAFARTVRGNSALKDVSLVALTDALLEPAVMTALGFTASIIKTLEPAALYETLVPMIASPNISIGRAKPHP